MSFSAFFYGSLMSKVVLLRVLCGRNVTDEEATLKYNSIQLKPTVLKEYRRSCIKNEDYPGIVFTGNPHDSVAGILCTGLTLKDIESLDIFEGEDYERIKVNVSDKDNVMISTDAYLFIGGEYQLTGEEWSFEHFINAGKEQKWLEDRCEFYQVDEHHDHTTIGQN